MTPEGKVKKEVKAYLDSLGPDCWYYMPMSFGYGRRGVMDFIICYKGFMLAPETKRAGGKSEPWQEREQHAVRRAGGKSARCTDVQTVMNWVRRIDRLLAAYPAFYAV